jgi:hypothetical protein
MEITFEEKKVMDLLNYQLIERRSRADALPLKTNTSQRKKCCEN